MIKILPFIPLISLFINFSVLKFNKIDKFAHFSATFLAILFFVQSWNLGDNYSLELLSLEFLRMPSDFVLALNISAKNKFLLLTLAIIWLNLIIYSKQYFSALKQEDHKAYFNFFLPLIIFLIAGLILSKNLLTLLFFYQFLSLVIYFALSCFAGKKSAKSIRNFGIFLVISPIFFFLAASMTFFKIGEIEFVSKGIFGGGNVSELFLIFAFYLIAICAIAFAPFYLFFKNLHFLNPPILILSLISFGFLSIILLLKVIFGIFGAQLFNSLIDQNSFLLIFLAANLFLSAFLAIYSQNLKQILVYLFFNQLILLVIIFLFFGLNAKRMQIISTSFLLGQALVFLIFSNIGLYLKSSKTPNIVGIFAPLKLNVLALIFIFLNFAGLITAVGFVEKFWLFQDASRENSLINIIILALNIGLILFLAVKLIWPMLVKNPHNSQLRNAGKNLELNFALMLPIILIPAILFLLSFPFLTKYLITF